MEKRAGQWKAECTLEFGGFHPASGQGTQPRLTSCECQGWKKFLTHMSCCDAVLMNLFQQEWCGPEISGLRTTNHDRCGLYAFKCRHEADTLLQ